MHSSAITVECANVRKAYRRGTTVTTVLIDIDLQVCRGECIVLAGPSGSGKTTLLSILGCTLRADEGRVTVFGRDISQLSAAELARFRRDQIGFLFQRFHLIRGLSAVENVSVPLVLAGVSEREAQRAAAERLQDVGLAESLRQDPRQMSVGQCQRVALARAVVHRPQLLLADEPTASLDAKTGDAAMRLIRRIVDEEDRTAIIVTHDTRVFDYADRVLELRGGRLVGAVDAQSGGRVEETEPHHGEHQAEVALSGQRKTTADPWSVLSREFPARGLQRLSTDN